MLPQAYHTLPCKHKKSCTVSDAARFARDLLAAHLGVDGPEGFLHGQLHGEQAAVGAVQLPGVVELGQVVTVQEAQMATLVNGLPSMARSGM